MKKLLITVAALSIGMTSCNINTFQAYNKPQRKTIIGPIEDMYTTTYGKETLKWKVINGNHIHYSNGTKQIGDIDTVYVRDLIHTANKRKR